MQKPEIDEEFLSFLLRQQVTIEEYLYVYVIYHKIKSPLAYLVSDQYEVEANCIRKNLINQYGVVLTRGLNLINAELITDDWIEEWRNLFPKGFKQGSIPLRGDRQSIEKKMQKFFRTYPFTKEIVFQATKKYLMEQAKDNYTYTKVAQYLIEKDGASVLAGLCEAFVESPETTTEDVWMKKART